MIFATFFGREGEEIPVYGLPGYLLPGHIVLQTFFDQHVIAHGRGANFEVLGTAGGIVIIDDCFCFQFFDLIAQFHTPHHHHRDTITMTVTICKPSTITQPL